MKEWPDTGPPVLWTIDGIGEGYSSVSIKDDLIYVTGKEDSIDANNLYILGFSGMDLSDLWSGYQKLFELTAPQSRDIFNKLIYESTVRTQRIFCTRTDLIKRINQD